MRKSKKSPLKESPLGTLTEVEDEDEVPVAEVGLNADEGLIVHVFGADNFSTPPSSPERSVAKGNEDGVAAPAPKWEIGQRVRVAQRGEGTLLYIGKMPSQSKNAASEVWYGVDLDDLKGKNNGYHAGKKYFYCLEGHGTVVQAEKLQMADMSQQELVMKALLKGEEVSDAEVLSLRNRELELFLARKNLKVKLNQKKDV